MSETIHTPQVGFEEPPKNSGVEQGGSGVPTQENPAFHPEGVSQVSDNTSLKEDHEGGLLPIPDSPAALTGTQTESKATDTTTDDADPTVATYHIPGEAGPVPQEATKIVETKTPWYRTRLFKIGGTAVAATGLGLGILGISKGGGDTEATAKPQPTAAAPAVPGAENPQPSAQPSASETTTQPNSNETASITDETIRFSADNLPKANVAKSGEHFKITYDKLLGLPPKPDNMTYNEYLSSIRNPEAYQQVQRKIIGELVLNGDPKDPRKGVTELIAAYEADLNAYLHMTTSDAEAYDAAQTTIGKLIFKGGSKDSADGIPNTRQVIEDMKAVADNSHEDANNPGKYNEDPVSQDGAAVEIVRIIPTLVGEPEAVAGQADTYWVNVDVAYGGQKFESEAAGRNILPLRVKISFVDDGPTRRHWQIQDINGANAARS